MTDDPRRPSKTRVNKAGQVVLEYIRRERDLTEEELRGQLIVVVAWREQHAYPISLAVPSLRNWVERYSSIGTRPSQRLKRVPRMIEKLDRHPGMKLARMQDVAGARAILRSREEVEHVHMRIRQHWRVVGTKDWRDHGRPDSGYRALHIMVSKRDRVSDDLRTVEIQLRTASQQRWAEVVSETEDRLGMPLRDGAGPPELVEYFRAASDLLAAQDGDIQALPVDFPARFADLREQVRSYFQ